jgi:hypothetical protein
MKGKRQAAREYMRAGAGHNEPVMARSLAPDGWHLLGKCGKMKQE